MGLLLSGNICGLSAAELAALTEGEVEDIRARATADMKLAGADLVIDSLADLPDAIALINAALAEGRKPGGL